MTSRNACERWYTVAWFVFFSVWGCTGTDTQAQAISSETTPKKQFMLVPQFDSRMSNRLNVRLKPWLTKTIQPTDIQTVPGTQDTVVILEKKGRAIWYNHRTGLRKVWFSVSVLSRSEQGLLGIAFHPSFAQNGRFFINHNVSTPDGAVTRIAEWHCMDCGERMGIAREKRVILDVPQPWANHNAGQLQFGPDGHLYIGLGDGGAANDPRGHGQNLKTLLGSMLRIDVDGAKPYAIPKDNPFIGRANVRPEIWAYGLRNPWRFTFDTRGRLITADVGQNRWEKVSVVPRGGNLGWKVTEGPSCFEKSCDQNQYIKPLFSYSHDDGQSITGGLVYRGQIPELKGRYVFADFVSGRMWAMPLNQNTKGAVHSLGRWSINPSCFGTDASGELLVADFGSGTIYKMISEPIVTNTQPL